MPRAAPWLLFLVVAAQALNLWPLPGRAADTEIALWSKLKAEWEATDPSKSENPEWTAKGKSESLARIDEALAHTDAILYRARIQWGMWLACAVISLAAAVLALRASRHWRWLAILSVPLFLWLEQPWYMLRVFNLGGEFDMIRGVHTLGFIGRESPATLAAMLLLNVVVPIVLFVVAAYAAVDMTRRTPHAL